MQMHEFLLTKFLCVITDAAKTGVAQETIQNTIRRGSKTMVEQEARQVLGVTESSSWEEILQVLFYPISGVQPLHICFHGFLAVPAFLCFLTQSKFFKAT